MNTADEPRLESTERQMPKKYENRGGEVWERHTDGRRELFAADIIERLNKLEREQTLADTLARTLKVARDYVEIVHEKTMGEDSKCFTIQDIETAITAWEDARK